MFAANRISTLTRVLTAGPVIPVVTLHSAAAAVSVAQALLRGGIKVIEITLRTPAALECIKAVAYEVPEMIVGAGTVLSTQDLERSLRTGATFAVSPGITSKLLGAAGEDVPLLPGVATASDLMLALDHGCTLVKFFPAAVSGGVKALRAFAGPFPQVRFCPTGGITAESANDYLQLHNVPCVGGTWLTPTKAMDAQNWDEIERLAQAAATRLTRHVAD